MILKMSFSNRSSFITEENVQASSSFNPKQLADQNLLDEKLSHVERQNNCYHHRKSFRNSHYNDNNRENERRNGVVQGQLPMANVFNGASERISLVHHKLLEQERQKDERGAQVSNVADRVGEVRELDFKRALTFFVLIICIDIFQNGSVDGVITNTIDQHDTFTILNYGAAKEQMRITEIAVESNIANNES